MIKVKCALVSVSDKKGLIPFVKKLYEYGIEIISTGGTARHLKAVGIPAKNRLWSFLTKQSKIETE